MEHSLKHAVWTTTSGTLNLKHNVWNTTPETQSLAHKVWNPISGSQTPQYLILKHCLAYVTLNFESMIWNATDGMRDLERKT